MTMRRVLGGVAGAMLFAAAGVAAAGNFASSAHSDFFASGKHQFYVWCAGSADYMATATGRDAEDAQLRLYGAIKASGHSTCWPVWQGRVRT
jgi:hypothetical protein